MVKYYTGDKRHCQTPCEGNGCKWPEVSNRDNFQIEGFSNNYGPVASDPKATIDGMTGT